MSARTADPGSDAPLAYTPMHVLAERLRAGALSASEIVDCYLQRIDRHDEKLHAYVEVYGEAARAAAALADNALKAGQRRGPLHGLPVALKDLVEIEGRTTTGGSQYWRHRVSSVTATIVRRLEAAGMIVLGKTHMVEFAFGSWGTNSAMGTPWNPWDARTHRVPGGSSSGSAVAVAAGLAPAAIGSDTGGSVRIPASLCGIVGLKPTAGRVSNHGTLRLSATLDTLGPMTRDVEDAALLFSIMHGPDSNDPETLTQPAADVFTDLRTGVGGLRLGVLPQHELGEVDPEVARAFAAALDVFRALGARTGELALPGSYKRFADLTGKLIAAEGYALHREWIGRDDLPFDREVRDRIRWAQALSADDYADILAQREQYRRAMARCWGNFDALLIPATPLPAIPLGEVDQSKSPMSLLTRPVNLLGLCALALPCGFTASGLPVSLQIAGRPYAEARVLQIGRAYENATPWRLRHPAETPAGGNSTR